MASVEPTEFVWITDPASGKRTKKPARETTWRARYRDPSGGTRSKTFARKADAEQFLARNGTAIHEGDWTDPALRRTRFEEWSALWWKTTTKLSPSTRRGYERVLRLYIAPAFDGRAVGSITWIEVELFVGEQLKDGRSPKTVRHTTSVLSLIFKTAMRAKVIKENPASGHAVTVRRTKHMILNMEQVHRLVDNTDARFKAGVWLLVLAGLRTSELCGLRVCDVDLQRHTITIAEVQMWVTGELVVKGPKSDSGNRVIPLPEWLVNELVVVMETRAVQLQRPIAPEDRIFVSKNGVAMTDNRVWKIIDRAQTKAKLPRFRPYDLRHSHASLLIELGAHPKAISERMGHSEIGVTMNVYGHLFEGAQRQLTDQLDATVQRNQTGPSSNKPD